MPHSDRVDERDGAGAEHRDEAGGLRAVVLDGLRVDRVGSQCLRRPGRSAGRARSSGPPACGTSRASRGRSLAWWEAASARASRHRRCASRRSEGGHDRSDYTPVTIGIARSAVGYSTHPVAAARPEPGTGRRQLLPGWKLPVHDEDDVLGLSPGQLARGATYLLLTELPLLRTPIEAEARTRARASSAPCRRAPDPSRSATRREAGAGAWNDLDESRDRAGQRQGEPGRGLAPWERRHLAAAKPAVEQPSTRGRFVRESFDPVTRRDAGVLSSCLVTTRRR